MRDSLNIAATPVDEPCEQCGMPDYNPRKAQFECQVFIGQLIRQFGPEPQGARLFVKANQHDAGTYYEVECEYDEEFPASFAYALELEGNTPENWDQPAIDELARRFAVITNM